MPPERNHHRSKDSSLQIVVIPQGDAGSTKSFKASVKTIVLVCVGIVTIIAAMTVALIVFTPAGLLLPMSEEQLRQRYGAELFEVQQRLNRVSSEVLVLREYNNKLRKALGQPELQIDSTLDLYSSHVLSAELPPRSEVADSRSEASFSQSSQIISYRSAVDMKEEVMFRASFPIIAPAVGYISRRFESERGHNGIDYAGKLGSLIVAAAGGYVVFAGYSVDDGYTVILSHGGGYLTVYKHNQNVLTSVGDFVNRGEPIALLGNSGRTSYGPHLHFELWKDGQPKNPNEYLIASKL